MSSDDRSTKLPGMILPDKFKKRKKPLGIRKARSCRWRCSKWNLSRDSKTHKPSKSRPTLS